MQTRFIKHLGLDYILAFGHHVFLNITATFHGNGFEIDRWIGEV